MNKRGFAFSFAWLFAIIVGSVIIFLAVYASTSFLDSEKTIGDTEIGKELGILLTPIETSTEEGRKSVISLPEKSVVDNDCIDIGNFGSQRIGVGSGVSSTFFNKYIFSSDKITGKELYVFSKRFSMPYKVADVMFIWSDEEKYCFVDPPEEVESDVVNLDLNNVEVASAESECAAESKKVCFSSFGCDVDVFLAEKSVTKNGEKVYYDDSFDISLLYGAIFSDVGIYECQVSRLIKRTSELALIYAEKSDLVAREGCSSLIDFRSYSNTEINDSSDLAGIGFSAKEIDRQNENSICEIY